MVGERERRDGGGEGEKGWWGRGRGGMVGERERRDGRGEEQKEDREVRGREDRDDGEGQREDREKGREGIMGGAGMVRTGREGMTSRGEGTGRRDSEARRDGMVLTHLQT
jgi:hypothetical protein